VHADPLQHEVEPDHPMPPHCDQTVVQALEVGSTFQQVIIRSTWGIMKDYLIVSESFKASHDITV